MEVYPVMHSVFFNAGYGSATHVVAVFSTLALAEAHLEVIGSNVLKSGTSIESKDRLTLRCGVDKLGNCSVYFVDQKVQVDP